MRPTTIYFARLLSASVDAATSDVGVAEISWGLSRSNRRSNEVGDSMTIHCRFTPVAPNCTIYARHMEFVFGIRLQTSTTIFTARCNARIASAVLAIAIRPSVRLSVCHTPVLCQNDCT